LADSHDDRVEIKPLGPNDRHAAGDSRAEHADNGVESKVMMRTRSFEP
jgi:hypothetical protein